MAITRTNKNLFRNLVSSPITIKSSISHSKAISATANIWTNLNQSGKNQRLKGLNSSESKYSHPSK